MAKYAVEYTRTAYIDFDVEAEDKEQAEEIAYTLLEEAIWDGDVGGSLSDWDLFEIYQPA